MVNLRDYFVSDREVLVNGLNELGLKNVFFGDVVDIIDTLGFDGSFLLLKKICGYSILGSNFAFELAKKYPDKKNILVDYINHDDTCLLWVKEFGDKEKMMCKVHDPDICLLWAIEIGDIQIMRDRVKYGTALFYWVLNFGDYELMRERVTDKKTIDLWIKNFGDFDYFAKKFPNFFG